MIAGKSPQNIWQISSHFQEWSRFDLTRSSVLQIIEEMPLRVHGIIKDALAIDTVKSDHCCTDKNEGGD